MDWFDIMWELFPYLFIGTLAVWLYKFLEKRIINLQRQRRLKRGKNAELGAKKLLEKNGYTVHDYQPALSYNFKADSEIVKVNISPDFIVEKGGTKYVVEVKTGEVAGNANYAATRRQMLEYNLASELPLLFVNMDHQSIHEIRFPFSATSNGINWWKYLGIIMLSVVGITIIAMAVKALLKLL
ncbi:MAG: hypothetical protein CL840_17770 [Crocinitomicaceae bacterium]|nr:hypothetical protein [Crocinitomicaceae bacterium]|tara:strand:+ start:10456 stop:11007 length:552 start_codon:yes stop_codon:yes gene_type:complete